MARLPPTPGALAVRATLKECANREFGIDPASGPLPDWPMLADGDLPPGAVRVYLDLNHWVALKDARLGLSAGAVARPVYDYLLEALRDERVVVVLGSSLYTEVAKMRRLDHRTYLADTMGEVSGFATLGSPSEILAGEVEAALHARTGRPMFPARAQVFGYGIGNAFGHELRGHVAGPYLDRARAAFQASWGASLEEFESECDLLTQYWLLRGPAPDDLPKMPDFVLDAILPIETARLDREKELAANLAADPKMTARLSDIVVARALYWELPTLGDHLRRANMSVDSFFSKGKEWITAFVNDLPSIATDNVLRFGNHRNTSHRWELNDIRDSDALRAAVPYCDVVVTERHATHLLCQAGLDQRFGTQILNKLDALPAAVEAVAAGT